MTVTENGCVGLIFNTLDIHNITAESVTDLSVQYSYNCAASTTVDLTADKLDVFFPTNNSATGTNISLTPQLLYNSSSVEKFCEGIYYFQWSITSDGTTYIYSICTLVDCESKIKCAITQYYLDNNDPIVIFLYNALQFQNDCDTCSCSEACKIYKKLTNLLNLNNVSTNDCGCS